MLEVIVAPLWTTYYSGMHLLCILTAKISKCITEQYAAHSSATIASSIICVYSLSDVSVNLYAFTSDRNIGTTAMNLPYSEKRNVCK